MKMHQSEFDALEIIINDYLFSADGPAVLAYLSQGLSHTCIRFDFLHATHKDSWPIVKAAYAYGCNDNHLETANGRRRLGYF